MLIKAQNLSATNSGFYRKSEIEFIGSEIDFSFMTDAQLDRAIYESIILYNKLFPRKKSRFHKYFKTAVIVGITAGSGAAVLASYGMTIESAMATAEWVGGISATSGSSLATVQSAATGISVAGMLYGKVTGEKPNDLLKAADLISSKNAGDVMEKVAMKELSRRGGAIQTGNIDAQNALREKIRREQLRLAENLRKQAAVKANQQGQTLPDKKSGAFNLIALATPFILMKLG